MTSKDHLW